MLRKRGRKIEDMNLDMGNKNEKIIAWGSFEF